jgi:hypothetical protein
LNQAEEFKRNEFLVAFGLFNRAVGAEEAGRNDSTQLGYMWNNIALCWYEIERYVFGVC